MLSLNRCIVLVFLGLLLLSSFSFAVTDEERAQNVLKKAAARLGWPETVVPAENNTVGKQFFISADGLGEDSEIKGSIVVLDTDLEAPFWLGFMESQLMFTRGNYMGRDAVFQYARKECNPTGLVKVINEIIAGFFESIFGPSEDDNCVTFTPAIMWSCGKFIFIAANEANQTGMEERIAAAIYAAAQEEKFCEYGDTLVIPAAASDKAGTKKLEEFQKIAKGINDYYAANTYGKQQFSYTFKDADSSKGDNDWYVVAPTQTGMASADYFEAAVKAAFNGTDISDDLRFARIVVIYSGSGKQNDPNAVFSTADSWVDTNYFVEVDGGDGKKHKVFTTDKIMVAENDGMGTWAHEFGHSLWWKYKTDGVWNRINDRYNYAGKPQWQYGACGAWDLMGNGNYLGNPIASNPSQMSAYTKEAAGWLSYINMDKNHTYVDKALEFKKAGDSALQFDDPLSNDARFFYVVESRDSTGNFSAPENGVVVYKVAYDTANTHEIVNNLWPQNGTTQSQKDGRNYVRPTLHGTGAAGDSVLYRNVPGKFRLRLVAQDNNPYTGSVILEDFNATNMVGASVAPNGTAPVVGNNDTSVHINTDEPMPDIDLHAYDSSNNHVGQNYQTGEYEVDIPGAIASGDLKDDAEWIFVPQGTQVRFEVSGYKTEQFLKNHPEYRGAEKPQEFTGQAIKIDSQGNQMEADLGTGSVGAGQNVQIKSPDDQTLAYKQKDYPGFGNSWCSFLPFVLIAVLVCSVWIRKGKIA